MIKPVEKFLFKKARKLITEHHNLSYLFWECTTRCNLNCLHCGSDCSKESNYKDMPLDDFLKAIDQIKNPDKNFTVVLTGGEPLMRRDLEQAGREIRKRGMKWSMVTNGYHYDELRHNALLNAGIGALTISLDGLQQSHTWLRNTKLNYQKVLDAIKLAASSPRLNFDVVTCVNTKNLNELPQILRLLEGLKVKSWRLFTIVPIGRAKDNSDLLLSNPQFITLMEFISNSRKNQNIDVKFSCEGYVGKYEKKVRDSFYFCRAGINIGSILIDGSISACPNIDRSFVQGNIYSDNFYDIWNSKFIPFRDRNWTKKGKCKNCSSYDNCLGNGFHNWHGDKKSVLVCHYEKSLPLSNSN